MKKVFLTLACAACTMALSAEDYNRIGISFDHTGYSFNKELWATENSNLKDPVKGFGMNGVGINYIHGFSLSESIPLYLETGANIDFMFGSKKIYDDAESKNTLKTSNINMQVPVNIAYKFNINDDFSITPYLGINFKVNFSTKFKGEYENKITGEKEKTDWFSLYSSEDIVKYYSGWEPEDGPISDEAKEKADDLKWNRFQMGWQVGVGFQYKPIYLGVQWGTDFIPAYDTKFETTVAGETISYHPKVNTNNLKVTLGYVF